MKDICCYIIHSNKLNRFYTGIYQNSLEERIYKHNTHFYSNKSFTAKAEDWTLFLRIDTENIAHARRIELKIKAMKSAVFIKNLKKYPELIEKIISQCT
jgi:putative endonuclease